MKRDPESLANQKFDVLVVGGGIHGICAARDAALRGLSVALVERGDFGAETSHNSLKLIHGGMRYIQHLEFGRMRQSVRERRAWLRIAPHLVQPLQFAIQTHGHITRGPEALWVAARVHELIGFDRNRGVAPQSHIPRAGVCGGAAAAALLPGVDPACGNGAATWHDGQMQDADRLLLECAQSAVDAGAVIANYTEAVDLVSRNGRVLGANVRDVLADQRFTVLAEVTILAAGPWNHALADPGAAPGHSSACSMNMNLVLRRSLVPHGLGVRSRRKSDSRVDSGGRLYFITPWRGVSLVGTTHDAYQGDPDSAFVTDQYLEEFIDEINQAYPPADIDRDDVIYCHWGLTPGQPGGSSGEARRARHSRVVEHGTRHGPQRLVSMVSVKWTTARLVAERAVDVAAGLLGRNLRDCISAEEPLPGAVRYSDAAACRAAVSAQYPELDQPVAADLATDFGSRWSTVMDGAGTAARSDEVLRRRVEFAIEQEAAQTLSDVLFRRMNLLQRGLLSQDDVAACVDIMGARLSWSQHKMQVEQAAFEQQCQQSRASVNMTR